MIFTYLYRTKDKQPKSMLQRDTENKIDMKNLLSPVEGFEDRQSPISLLGLQMGFERERERERELLLREGL
jgi:hypothetical protein